MLTRSDIPSPGPPGRGWNQPQSENGYGQRQPLPQQGYGGAAGGGGFGRPPPQQQQQQQPYHQYLTQQQPRLPNRPGLGAPNAPHAQGSYGGSPNQQPLGAPPGSTFQLFVGSLAAGVDDGWLEKVLGVSSVGRVSNGVGSYARIIAQCNLLCFSFTGCRPSPFAPTADPGVRVRRVRRSRVSPSLPRGRQRGRDLPTRGAA